MIKKKKPKSIQVPLQPLWWGVSKRVKEVYKPEESKDREKEREKENEYSRSGLLGTKRINLLRHSIISKE